MPLDVSEVVHVLAAGGRAILVRGAGPLSGTTVIPCDRCVIRPNDVLNVAKLVIGHERVPLVVGVRHQSGVDRLTVVNGATETSGVVDERLALGDENTGFTVGYGLHRLRCHTLSLHHPDDKRNT